MKYEQQCELSVGIKARCSAFPEIGKINSKKASREAVDCSRCEMPYFNMQRSGIDSEIIRGTCWATSTGQLYGGSHRLSAAESLFAYAAATLAQTTISHSFATPVSLQDFEYKRIKFVFVSAKGNFFVSVRARGTALL